VNKDIVVVGASAGGMDALQKLVTHLPKDFPASLFVVWHMSPGVKSALPEVLGRASALPVLVPADGDPIVAGQIYVAPNDHHMLLEHGYIRIAKGPKENRFRPALDPLFRSAAYVYGTRVTGVVLSGALDDGTAGLWTIKLRGGTAIVQEPSDAGMRSMPLSALNNVDVDYKLPATAIGELLGRLVREEAEPEPELPETLRRRLEHEIRIAEEHNALDEQVMRYGELSPFTCPECHGVLTALREGRIQRYRCHTGHAFSRNALLEATGEQIEARLWDAVRALDETVMLLDTMGREFAKAGDTRTAELCFDKAREAHQRSQPLRESARENDVVGTNTTEERAKKQHAMDELVRPD
jgi:two-component system, chemotaxis family, protein-glutamate methylesterase/glutaminase